MRQSLARTQSGIDDSIVLTPVEVNGIFSDVVGPTLDYIDQQLAEMARFTGVAPKNETIVLAGGFSASPYLQEAIRRRFANRATVIKAQHPETAVLNGAVHFARDPEITRIRRVEYTWGIGVVSDFDSSIHDAGHRKMIAGRDACDGLFSVYVRDGDPIGPNEPVIRTHIPYSASSDNIHLELYSTKDRWPKYVDDPGCDKSAEMTIAIGNMKHLPREGREVEVAMFFGRTELEVHATNRLSRETKKVRVKYSYTFER
jgi:hypothetical protein